MVDLSPMRYSSQIILTPARPSAAALVLLCSICAMAACGQKARQYTLEGQILAVRPDTHELLIKHGDIANFMPGMTMPFRVAEPRLLEGKSAGDLIKATLNVSDTDAWISAVEKTGSAPLPDVPAPGPAVNAELLGAGEMAPDTPLLDQQGQPLRLTDWRGSAVAVTFIYTRCPLPQFCPTLDRRFAEVQRLAAADATLAGHVRLLSVSFDPDADTPAMLAAHAATLDADAKVWRFATAPRDEVDRFAIRFGVNVIRENDGTITHNMRTAVIDPKGRITKLLDGSQWTADDLVAELRAAVAGS
jgi:protein SCO1